MAMCPNCFKEKELLANHCPHCVQYTSIGNQIEFSITTTFFSIIGFILILIWIF